ncbi:MAG: DUF445 family protein [Firmicutes bacterium]|nr:DUF445 family protein [Bacillota bacterium]
MDILSIVLPVLIGAVIGYCTNYLAIRMLFHPYKAVKIGKWTLPFTPGIIPKNQSRVASAVGTAVSEQLLTKDVIYESFHRDGSGKKLIAQMVSTVCESEKSVSELLPPGGTQDEILEGVRDYLARTIMEKISGLDMVLLTSQIGREAIDSLISNRPFLSMFLNDSTQNMIYEKLGQAAKDYVDRNGEEIVRQFVTEYLAEMKEKPLREIIESTSQKEKVESLLSEVIEHLALRYGESLLDQVDVKEITRRRIEEMQVDEVETLVLSVMKHELQAVINLGALIGAVIGTINVFI